MDKIVNKRIEWVDIFKALTIISVVIGHSTGAYNMFIYQFHMAAFFFISGYTTDLGKRSVLETIWVKMCTMILPLLTIFVLGLGFVAVLDYLGAYNALFADSFIGVVPAIKQFIAQGNNYVLWMGAAWFIVALFGSVVIQKCISHFFNNKIGLGYILTTIIVFLIGYVIVKRNIHMQISIFTIDLILIAQFYFGMGLIFKEYKLFERLYSARYRTVLICLSSILLLYYFGFIHPTTVDYPSRRFGIPFIDAFAAINGIQFIYLLSILLNKLPSKIKKGIQYIGRNTISIVFFHFMFFNVVFYILYLCNIVSFSYLKNFTPTEDIGKQFWWLFVIIAIPLSIGLWKFLTLSKIFKVLLGEDKVEYAAWYKTLNKSLLLKKLNGSSLDITLCYRFINYIREHYVIFFLSFFITVLTTSPMLIQGIMCNDELQARFARFAGFSNLINRNVGLELSMGRPLRILAAYTHALSFPSTQLYLFRSFQIGILLLSIIIFGYFIYNLFGNKKFSIFTSIFALVFLPITFEHAIPNAFVGLTCLPISVLLLSFIFFMRYLNKGLYRFLFLSMAFYIISMLCYEFIITFVFVFPILYFASTRHQKLNIKKLINITIIPISCAAAYLIALLFSQKLIPEGYEGVQIGFISIKSSLDIITTLFLSALPGYYIFNGKYEYLMYLYNNSSTIQPFQKIISLFDLRVFLLIVTVGIFLIYLLRKDKNGNLNNRFSIYFIFYGLLYSVLPILPNSISKLYQGNVNANNFTSLPVTYFVYFSVCLTICYIIWSFIKWCTFKHIGVVISLIICLYCLPVQAMNSVFSNVQYNDYSRLTTIEKIFDTNTIKNMDKQSIYAADLYLTKNALAIQDGYWNDFARLKGLVVDFHKKNDSNYAFKVYFQQDKYLTIVGGNEIAVLSPKLLLGNSPVQVDDSKYLSYDFREAETDGPFFLYHLQMKQTSESTGLEAYERNRIPFESMVIKAGNTLKTANIIKGVYADGWLDKSSEFEIKTGDKGVLIFTGYYPNKIAGNETGTIYINGNPNAFSITENSFTIEISAPPQSIANVKIENNFSFSAQPPDIRELSFILSDVVGQ